MNCDLTQTLQHVQEGVKNKSNMHKNMCLCSMAKRWWILTGPLYCGNFDSSLAGHVLSIIYADQCGSIKIRSLTLIQNVAQ